MAETFLNISPEGQAAVTKIDEDNYFELGKQSTPRLSLYMLAGAVGIETGLASPLASKTSFVRGSYIDQRTKALLTAFAVNRLVANDEPIEMIKDDSFVNQGIEAYANTGLFTIGGYADEKSEEILTNEWIIDLDKRYEELFPGPTNGDETYTGIKSF